jgi:enoyl-CoA hydratase/carnithine racemase
MAPDTHLQADEQVLLRDDAEGICTLTLNRPDKRNPLSTQMLSALQNTLDDIADDKTVKVVILAAKGPVFCSGHDLKEMRANTNYNFIHELFLQCSRMMVTMTQLPQPIIAKVHGVATAAGCQLVASCDLAIAAESAKFGTPGVTNGLFCSTPAVAVSRAVSRKHAMEMLLLGKLFSPEDALRFGLINRIVPVQKLDSTVLEYAESIASRSTLTMSMGKAAFYRQLDMELEDAYTYTSDVMARNMMERDAQEGIDAFLQKRHPKWTGR